MELSMRKERILTGLTLMTMLASDDERDNVIRM